MATTKSIQSKRRMEKASISRAVTFIGSAPEDADVEQIECRSLRVDDAYNKLKELTIQLYDFEGEADFVDPEKDFAEYEAKYFSAKGSFEKMLNKARPPREATPLPQDNVLNQLAEQHSSLLDRLDSPLNVRSNDNDLPKIRVEPFTGKYKDWPAFKDIFISAIDSKPNLSNIRKFHYLKSLLKDDAANLIKHMQISDLSYSTAWGRLQERYDRPRHIVNSYIETFMSISAVKDENSSGLRKISNISNEVIRGLEAIGYDERDYWLIYMLQTKIDSVSRNKWIEQTRGETKPTIYDFLAFLDQRCEEIELGKNADRKHSSKVQQPTKNWPHTMVATNNIKTCSNCHSDEHYVHNCQHFLSLNVGERRKVVKDKHLCFNCLRNGHSINSCKSKGKCRICQGSHNTLLHISSGNSQQESPSRITTSSSEVSPQLSFNTLGSQSGSKVLNKPIVKRILPTALVNVRNYAGNYVTCRILLDTASEYSYISEDCIKRLGLHRHTSRMSLSGIQSVKADPTRGHAYIHLRSRLSQHEINTCVHVLGQITASLPRSSIRDFDSNLLNDIELADPQWYRSSPIDILLGVDEVWEILSMRKLTDNNGKVFAISSIFGWIITSGFLSCENHVPATLHTLADIDQSIRAFWELEDCPNINDNLDNVELLVEQHFRQTVSRHTDGKYVVELPFKEHEIQFSDTYKGALSRFLSTERRLARNSTLRAEYIKFMQDYESLGHMREMPPNEIDVPHHQVYYLPHHPVIGPKLRVVFDGSFADSTGVSLNDRLHIGPAIQRNLFAVCLRFRLHEFVLSADIIKMFRQIWVTEKHRNFQRILWRETADQPIKHFQLCTVTYGTASAPFLSVRVLQQLAEDYEQSHPSASRILREDFYVDDVVTGASSEQQLLNYRDELIDLLSKAGLELSKWVSNTDKIIPSNQKAPSFLRKQSNSAKVLGIHWDSDGDVIGYKICLGVIRHATKRTILSDVARIFDPLGLVSPVVIKFKILFQELWLMDLGWDEPLPLQLAETWSKYRKDLERLEALKLPRFVPNEHTEITLHGFSDASTKAYSAVLYCLMKDEDGNTQVSLVASKTRVAPLKQITLPRLELCGALLLTRLIKSVIASLPNRRIRFHAWCDSTVVLSWLSVQPVKLKTFVGNRTAEILDTLPRNVWKHVRTKENPADCASRGLMVDQLLDHELWWSGPTFLANLEQLEPSEITETTESTLQVEAEMRKATISNIVTQPAAAEQPLEMLIEKTSTWWKLLRITAYVKRFINLRVHRIKVSHTFLTLDEIKQAKTICIRVAQKRFSSDFNNLQRGLNLNKTSQLLKLSPYIDEDGLIRVGGRIRHSELAETIQHPIILPKNHKITKLIIDDQHTKNLHPGVSSLFVILRQQYWIIGARNMIRQATHNCLKCFRQAQHTTQQRMADLPAVRVRKAFPFENTGCDYAGPLMLRSHQGRNAKTCKGYICLFVCMVTSAIHLELSTDLTTECFLAALRRFMARRGKCSTIFSDNGKNFVGAKRVLNELYQHVQADNHNELVTAALAQEGIKWVFTPPYSPHWGGIWESGVRSVKLHLRRVIGDNILTFEQMHTLLAQVEAVVNSRPLGYASDTDTNYLSPSHLLLGRPTTIIPEGNLTDVKPNRLDYWQHVQCMYQGFWKRWSQEYLTSLQCRPKWCNSQPNIQVEDIVLVKEDRTPPSTWIMARVSETFPGADGMTRAVKLRTAKGTITRNITKLVKLPVC